MSKSKSSSSQASNVTDRRIGATDDAIVLAEGATGSFSVVNQITDAGALQVASENNKASNELVEAALEQAFGFGRASLDFSGEVVEESFQFSNENIERVLDSNDRTIDGAFDVIEDVIVSSLKNVDTANKSLKDVSDHAITKVEASTRSDAAQSFNKLMETVAVGAIAYAFVMSVRG